MPRGENQSGKARDPKIKEVTDQDRARAESSAPAPTGRPKGGIIRWPKKK